MGRRSKLSYSDILAATQEYGYGLAIFAVDHTVALHMEQPSPADRLAEINAKTGRKKNGPVMKRLLEQYIRDVCKRSVWKQFQKRQQKTEEPAQVKPSLMRRLNSPEFNVRFDTFNARRENKAYSKIARKTTDKLQEIADSIKAQMYAILDDDHTVINTGYAVRGGNQLQDSMDRFDLVMSLGMYNPPLLENAVNRVLDDFWMPDEYKYALEELSEIAESRDQTLDLFLNQDNRALAFLDPDQWDRYMYTRDLVHEAVLPAYLCEAVNDVMHTSEFVMASNFHLPFATDHDVSVIDFYIAADIDVVAEMLDNLIRCHSEGSEEIIMSYLLGEEEFEQDRASGYEW